MGISDEDYAREKALQLQRAFELQQMKIEAEKQKEEQKMAGLLGSIGSMGVGAIQPVSVTSPQAGSVLVSTGTGTTWANTISMTQGVKVLDEKDLKHDAMTAPLSALVDMWQMRWQGEWVSENEFQDDDFWRLALIRLVGANKLEKHHLANSYAPVYRIIE